MTPTQEAVMRQALEALEVLDRVVLGTRRAQEAITALKAALAEPVQEPVAKVELMTTGGNVGLATRIVEIDDHLRERLRPGQLLYTAPIQRKPLTEEEIDEIIYSMAESDRANDRFTFVRAIERAHGIGGNDD